MIKIIIFLSKKSKWLNEWIKRFINVYSLQFPTIEAPENSKEYVEEICRKDLERVIAYEKLGKDSGLSAPRVIFQPK